MTRKYQTNSAIALNVFLYWLISLLSVMGVDLCMSPILSFLL